MATRMSRQFFSTKARLFAPGDRLQQKDLAATLRIVSDGGADAFYHGSIAAAVSAASRAHGGLLTREAFAAYTAAESAPITCTYRGYNIVSAPPPSSGGVTLCEMLQVLDGYPLKGMGFHSSASVHLLTESMRHAFRDRNTYLGDPAFVDNPIARLLSAENTKAIRAQIQADRATASSALSGATAANEHATTTHYSVVDKQGNAVSVTYDQRRLRRQVIIKYRFLLNDEMDKLPSPGPGALRPGARQGHASHQASGLVR